MADREYDPRRSSVAVGEDRKRGLLPLILGLLALLIIAAIVIGLVSCGSDDDKAASTSAPAAAAPAPATSAASPPTATPAPAGGATLTADSASLLAADAAKIADHVGDTATGVTVKVLSVVTSGFFVGTDDTDRQYVEYGGKVGQDESDATLPKVGDVVGLKGEVRPAPKSAGTTLKLSDADAKTVSDRGAYVNADSVVVAG